MTDLIVPRENVNDEVVIVRQLLVDDGAEVTAGQPIIEIETSKTVIEMEAPDAGVVRFRVSEGEEVPIGDVLCRIDGDESATHADLPIDVSSNGVAMDALAPATHVSKFAQTAAQKHGVKLSELNRRWIRECDVLSAAGAQVAALNVSDSRLAMDTDVHALHEATEDEGAIDIPGHTMERIDLRKRSEIANLSALGSGLLQSTIGVSSPPLDTRLNQAIPLFADGISDIVVYEASRLLREFPLLNGFFSGGHSRALYNRVHAGISFDSHCNLKVLRISDSDTLTLNEIQLAINSMLVKYEADENLSPELKPATFTITDLGHTRADFVFPLLNGYQSLILGIVRRPKNVFRLLAGFDHRMCEGLYVTRFLESLVRNTASHFAARRSSDRKLQCYFCEKLALEEERLGNRGLINVTILSGKKVMICRNCFDGW